MPAVEADLNLSQDPLQVDLQYHKGTIKANRRITAPDWYQDVRHLEFGFEDDIKLAGVTSLIVPPHPNQYPRYNPGDVAVIHPSASDSDTNAFLTMMKWDGETDNPFEIKQSMFGMPLSPDSTSSLS